VGAPQTNARPINLALQGGGAHGALTWGVVDRLLEEDRLSFASISGASAGAVNAAAIAYGLDVDGREGARASLEKLWWEIARVGAVFSPVRRSPLDIALGAYNLDNSPTYQAFDAFVRTLSPYQFNPFNYNPLREILERVIDFERLQHCKAIKLFLSGTNVRTGKVHVFEARNTTVNVVLASTCLPFLFQAVEIDGEHYWDGGYMGNPPLFPFFYETGCQDIVIVHINPLERDELPKTAPDIMNRINEISFNSSLLRELRAIDFVHRLLDEGWLKDEYRDRLKDIRVHSIRSDEAMKELSVASKFSTDWRFLTDLKDRGREIAASWLEANLDAVGTRSSVDLRHVRRPRLRVRRCWSQ